MKFHEKLRSLRKEANFTQKQIADVLGIDRSAYSYYETGSSVPPMPKMVILAKIFNCSVDELMCVNPPKTVVQDSTSIYNQHGEKNVLATLPRDEQDLLILYRSMSESMCGDVLKHMRNLLKISEE